MCNILFSVCPNMKNLNEISGVITSPFYPNHHFYSQGCSWEIRARKENEFYLHLSTWFFLGGTLQYRLARVIIWKFKVEPFQATMVPDGVYVVF